MGLHPCHCLLLKPFDLPLSTKGASYVHWTQLGTISQIQVNLAVRQSQTLVAKIDGERAVEKMAKREGAEEQAQETEAELQEGRKKVVAEIS